MDRPSTGNPAVAPSITPNATPPSAAMPHLLTSSAKPLVLGGKSLLKTNNLSGAVGSTVIRTVSPQITTPVRHVTHVGGVRPVPSGAKVIRHATVVAAATTTPTAKVIGHSTKVIPTLIPNAKVISGSTLQRFRSPDQSDVRISLAKVDVG